MWSRNGAQIAENVLKVLVLRNLSICMTDIISNIHLLKEGRVGNRQSFPNESFGHCHSEHQGLLHGYRKHKLDCEQPKSGQAHYDNVFNSIAKELGHKEWIHIWSVL